MMKRPGIRLVLLMLSMALMLSGCGVMEFLGSALKEDMAASADAVETAAKSLEDHSWMPATCEMPEICKDCGQTRGEALGHDWAEATESAPETCRICGATQGEPVPAEPMYLVDMPFCDKYGKLWTWSGYAVEEYTHTDPDDGGAYTDMNTRGHTVGEVYDHQGNRYTNGLCVDFGGQYADVYYVSYDLGGRYTTFSGVISLIEGMAGVSFTKYVEILCDGQVVFTSATMTASSAPQPFSLDVTGVQELTIRYPATDGQNRIATVFDGLVQ